MNRERPLPPVFKKKKKKTSRRPYPSPINGTFPLFLLSNPARRNTLLIGVQVIVDGRERESLVQYSTVQYSTVLALTV